MIICKKCEFENLEGTKYCQKCGSKLKESAKLFDFKNTKFLAGAGAKGSSIAPLAMMSVTNGTSDLGPVTSVKNVVKVLPLEDGRWYCPDCGELNPPHTFSCKGCGRDFV